MNIQFSNKSLNDSTSRLIIIKSLDQLNQIGNIQSDVDYLKSSLKENKLTESFLNGKLEAFVLSTETSNKNLELLRGIGYQAYKSLQKLEVANLHIENLADNDNSLALFEGIALSAYQFLKYKTKKDGYALNALSINGAEEKSYKHTVAKIEGTYITRTLVNEHPAYLTPTQFSKDIDALANQYGFSFTKLDRGQIESLKMGGLLAVNQASNEDPTFNIMEWKPAKPKNSQPIVLVGKGVVYDTGGLSLKPTPNAMDFMKADMAGAGAVVGAICAIAKAQLDVHVIGLIAATDNKIGSKAYSPGDVITMYDGTTVEVLNTDAEGRLTLADAISYGNKYEPELIVDIATLTGAAARAIGTEGSVIMGTAEEKTLNHLKAAGHIVHERLVEFPLWDEYGDQIKSDMADIKNLGGDMGGAITAGKFLEHFTRTPWMHIDIAAPSYLHHEDKYRGKNGTGVGVRLFFEWLANY